MSVFITLPLHSFGDSADFFYMESPLENPLAGYRKQVKPSFKIGPLIWALIIQVALLLIAVFVVVVIPNIRKDPEFVAKKTIYLPQRELEHSVALSEFQQVASKPALMERLTTEALISSDMPALPALPTQDFNPFDNAMNPLNDAAALLGESGLMGSLQGLVSESSTVSFFGIKDQATRIVIAFDISQSVLTKAKKSGISIQQLQEEAVNLIQELNANTLFGLIQFSRSYDFFEDYLVAGTKANKEAGVIWLEKEFRTDGKSGRGWIRSTVNGIQSVMEASFAWQPDVIFLISDGDFQRTTPSGGSENVPWDELFRDVHKLQEQSEKDARIHFVGFQVKPQHKDQLQILVGKYGGQYREL
ncbi:MAG: hypothetical protein KJT03_20975 [Verrucomicrobiae bacterium]|nr:hypothetical protein [Verrucomicrobiae bacterium]